MTVRFELEVRPSSELTDEMPHKRARVSLPPPTIIPNLLSLLEDGEFSDVTFVVRGQLLKAHSQVLAARCEVFKKQLQSGMRESELREVHVEDCEPEVFKALLLFLYSDDYCQVKGCMDKLAAEGRQGASGLVRGLAPAAVSFLQGVMAVSHRYQVSRLTLWCEQQLIESISEEHVCSMVVQAHLCEAKHLEEACLTYVKRNMEKVASTPEFNHLSAAWPQLLLKLSLSSLGVSSTCAASSLAGQEGALRKRKRE
jgi:speckle-type POZ protein